MILKRFHIIHQYSPLDIAKEFPLEFRFYWKKSLKRHFKVLYYLRFFFKYLVLVQTLYNKHKWIKIIHQKKNIPITQLYIQIIQLTLIKNIPLKYFFFFQLWRRENFNTANFHLYDTQIRHCFQQINLPYDTTILNDKWLFYQFCQKNNIPTPSIFAYIQDGLFFKVQNINNNHAHSIIIKPINGSQSKGISRWDYDLQHQQYINYQTKITKTWDEIIIQAQSQNNVLIQECLFNHKEVADLSNEALATIRIISMRSEDNKQIELFRPMYQMPYGKALHNYINDGAFIASVNIETGKLDTAFNGNILQENVTIHSKTNIQIKDRTLPHWHELTSIVIQTHRHLLPLPLIAWDVAITPNGIQILEGNINFAIDIHQRPPQDLIMHTRFFELFQFYLKKSFL